jgi:hypothetical protein
MLDGGRLTNWILFHFKFCTLHFSFIVRSASSVPVIAGAYFRSARRSEKAFSVSKCLNIINNIWQGSNAKKFCKEGVREGVKPDVKPGNEPSR